MSLQTHRKNATFNSPQLPTTYVCDWQSPFSQRKLSAAASDLSNRSEMKKNRAVDLGEQQVNYLLPKDFLFNVLCGAWLKIRYCNFTNQCSDQKIA